jgi:hypothetical protein
LVECEPLVGERVYILHFDADQLPPADAVWSVTVYDSEGFQAAKELDRFALGDRDARTAGCDHAWYPPRSEVLDGR